MSFRPARRRHTPARAARLLAAAPALALALAVPVPARAQNYRFPTSAADYAEFYPTAYKDHGAGTVETDWDCGGITYDGHNGSDFGFGSWAGMAAGRDVTAAADGTVVYVNDGCADDCSTGACGCGGGFGNYVKVTHADGKSTYYGHMKIWSVLVAVGDTVTCGQKLGEGGSSGNSTGPHLHFEPRNAGGTAEDTFDGPCSGPPSYWVVQGAYAALPSLDCDGGSPPPPPAFCTPAAGAPGCGTGAGGANDAGGSTDVVGSYACATWDYSGPEYAYTFTAATTEPVTATLTGLGADLDLFVLDASCNPGSCLTHSENSMTSDETVTFDATAGTTYTVVVDGYLGATSAFTLSMSCTGGTPPPPPGAPDLSMDISIDDIPGQLRDFNPDGASGGVFDVYAGQFAVHRLVVHNAASATARAEGVRLGVWAEEPYLRITRWDVYDDYDGNACGGAWCLNDANDDPANPPHDDPGQAFDLVLHGFAAGENKMVVLIVEATAESNVAGVDHPDVRGFVAHVDGVYDKPAFDTPPTFNANQTWNGGDLRIWSQTDVWTWDGPGDPPASSGFASGVAVPWPGGGGGGEGSGVLRADCGCAVVGRAAARDGDGDGTGGASTSAALLAALALVVGASRRRRGLC